jgi:hypothetical protein
MLNAKYEGITGKYFDRSQEIKSSELSYNKQNTENLWQRSIELTKLQENEKEISCKRVKRTHGDIYRTR